MRKSREEKKKKLLSAKKHAAERKAGFESSSIAVPKGMPLWNPKKPGIYRLDILPYTAGDGNPVAKKGETHYERTYYVHRGIGPDNRAFCCLKKNFGKACPICEYRESARNRHDVDEDLLKSLAPKDRQLWAIIDTADRGKGVQLWDVSYYLFGDHLFELINSDDENEGYEYFADQEKGSTLKITAKSKSFGGGAPFLDFANIQIKARTTEVTDEILEKVPCLDELLVEKSYKELNEIFMQGSADVAGSSSSRDDDDDDDDEDQDDEEDDDRRDEDDEDQEEDDEDQEEDDGDVDDAEDDSEANEDQDDEDEDEDDQDDEGEDPDEDADDDDGDQDDPDDEGVDEDDEDEDEDEDPPPAKKSKKPTPKPTKSPKPKRR